ncbi:phage tail sheath family protein [Hanamia caeni]|uniref:Phage tail sheath family protein n=1 Tax=Hanamia caeni TaxID=2294116 RepID=A0A3M9NS00_9BACT|nr:phage tail sheath C-terminal domain-containing protein [Hanamia caeni]RNI39828.1 phage tail sheath family protein [Hanamia caeni]
MPIQPTYPGVYIQEVSSGVHTITGVATSITAFIGRAERGPVDKPVIIYNFGDFQRIFGGLWNLSPMSFAVQDFFSNGGSQAVIVRLFHPSPGSPPGDGRAVIRIPTGYADPDDEIQLIAANPGAWGSNLTVTIDYNTKEKKNLPSGGATLFNLTVKELDENKKSKTIEQFLNVTTDAGKAGYLPRVLEQISNLVRVNTDSNNKYIVPTSPVKLPLEVTDETPLSPPSSPSMIPSAISVPGDDGIHLTSSDVRGDQSKKQGLYMLEKTDLFNILCIPPFLSTGDESERPIDIDPSVIPDAVGYCQKRRAIMIIDSISSWHQISDASGNFSDSVYPPSLKVEIRSNAALFFPRIKRPNILVNNEIEEFVPCGMIAGTFANTDTQRGVWKAPAGITAGLNGVTEFTVPMTDDENGKLNRIGINCLRSFPVYGNVIWGARTMDGADELASDWKYIPVRRTALFIEESLYRGTKWVVFEPNDEPLWSQIRLNIGAFMHDLFRKGAFQGKTPKEAYLVKCDSETTTQNDINSGIVNILVGFAPLKPAEFVIIQIQQLAGQIDT